jgi:hypothetical protein
MMLCNRGRIRMLKEDENVNIGWEQDHT